MALFTIVELARYQGISSNHVRDLISAGLPTHPGPCGKRMVDVDEYEDFVAEYEDDDDYEEEDDDDE